VCSSDLLVRRLLHPEPGRIDRELLSTGKARVVGDREEGNAVEGDLLEARVRTEDAVEQQVSRLVSTERYSGTAEEDGD